VISLALGLFQDFGTPRRGDEPPVDWVEGVAIMIAVTIVVSINCACHLSIVSTAVSPHL
jgi:Ca2+-transporting ATPase